MLTHVFWGNWGCEDFEIIYIYLVTLTHQQSNLGTKVFSITANINISAIILLKEYTTHNLY